MTTPLYTHLIAPEHPPALLRDVRGLMEYDLSLFGRMMLYVLWHRHENIPLYVGRSARLPVRLEEHRTDPWQWHRVYLVPQVPGDILRKEKALARWLRPVGSKLYTSQGLTSRDVRLLREMGIPDARRGIVERWWA